MTWSSVHIHPREYSRDIKITKISTDLKVDEFYIFLFWLYIYIDDIIGEVPGQKLDDYLNYIR